MESFVVIKVSIFLARSSAPSTSWKKFNRCVYNRPLANFDEGEGLNYVFDEQKYIEEILISFYN